NAINKVTESRTIPAGSIERQTVSVALNADVAGTLDVDEIAELVSAAAGIDPNRGDEVTVKLVGFSQAGAIEAAEALAAADAAAGSERSAEIIRTALIAFAIIISIVLGLVFFALRSRRQKREEVDMAALNEILTAPTVPMTFLSQPALRPPPASPPAPQSDVDRQRAEISTLAEKDPERAAEYLRGLMDDRQPA
ncbi:MAG: flagellar M-ring protein FliF, partial [Microbacteriaceae bacterium]|nr:flagellar M-ring protein FliF [Microbacteriaceae bacterium]